MKNIGTQTIETERLILKRFIMDDAEAMFKNWANDPEVTKYLRWPAHESVEVSRIVLQEWTTSYENDEYYQWAIVPKDFGEPIGSIGAVEFNSHLEIAHIGYCIGRKWWHMGIMSEALAAVIDFFFDKVGVNRVESIHDPNNPHSGDVMKKCGMKYEGTHRRTDWNNQGVCDAAWYAILAEDRQQD